MKLTNRMGCVFGIDFAKLMVEPVVITGHSILRYGKALHF